jgi:hypothetical protein
MILSRVKNTILMNSSAVGGIPVMISPIPITRKLSEKNMTLITIRAPKNLAFIR